MTRVRQGTGLLEVLVALPLMALLGIVAVQLLLGAHRQIVHADGVLGATRELRHSTGILAAELRVLTPRDLMFWSDTAVEFDGTVGVGFSCAARLGRAQLLLVGADSVMSASDPRATVWNQPPQAGDRVSVWLRGSSPTDSLRAASAIVRAVSVGTECEHSPLVRGRTAETVRLALVDSIAGNVATGTPVRISRRTRYSLYRAGDGDWFLGRRSRGLLGWDVVQPVAGPLSSPRDRGLVIRMYDAQGAFVGSANGAAPARVNIEVRAPRRSGRAAPPVPTIDSMRVDVALRADRSGAT